MMVLAPKNLWKQKDVLIPLMKKFASKNPSRIDLKWILVFIQIYTVQYFIWLAEKVLYFHVGTSAAVVPYGEHGMWRGFSR